MKHKFSRNELVYGNEGCNTLKTKCVAVIGVGGVGSFSAESLVRSGIGKIIILDKDVVDITNINRQIMALDSTVGKSKVDVLKERFRDINNECEVISLQMFYNEENKNFLFEHKIDFLIDAIDTITFKIDLIEQCIQRKIPFISVLGAANKMDPTKFSITTLEKTTYDPIAKKMRKYFKDNYQKIKVPVVFSNEIPLKRENQIIETDSEIRKVKTPPASNSFCPATAGLIATSYAIKKLLDI